LTNQYEPKLSQSGGDITITGVGALDIGGIDAQGFGGNGSSVILDSKNTITLSGSVINASSDIGDGGDIKLLADGDIILHSGSSIFSDGLLAGNITLMSGTDISVTSGVISSASFTSETGMTGGDIKVIARSLSLNGRFELGTLTQGDFGAAKAGNIIIQTKESVSLDGRGFLLALFSIVPLSGKGNGGNITLDTKDLLARNGAQISTATFGQGEAGELTVRAESVELIGETSDGRFSSGLFAGVAKTASGNGGNLTIKTDRLFVRDGAEVSLTTKGKGNAGNLFVKAQSIELIGTSVDGSATSGLLAQVDPVAKGNGGNLTVETDRLLIRDGARISVSTLGKGDAGDLTITAQSVELIGTSADGKIASSLLALVDSEARGNGGKVTINAQNLLVRDGALISVETRAAGIAGDITLRIRDNIILAGLDSGIFANTTSGSTGNGGNISIDTKTGTIQNSAKIGVDSQGTGIGGTIAIDADSLTLDNKALISAETASNTGGNLNLQVADLLLLRNASNISTTAGTAGAGGDGGNIQIDAKFIAAFADSNITANAFEGKGGNVNISTQGIFGIEFRERETSLSDITASSEFGVQGQVTIAQPDVDPSKGLVELPSNLTDASEQIVRECPSQGRVTVEDLGSFTIAGRGGLPPNPSDPHSSEIIRSNWATLPNDTEQKTVSIEVKTPTQPLVEARGWQISPDGKIVLVGQSKSNVSVYSNGCF
jgi:large exoprotein involved in heme utilization and adhesion